MTGDSAARRIRWRRRSAGSRCSDTGWPRWPGGSPPGWATGLSRNAWAVSTIPACRSRTGWRRGPRTCWSGCNVPSGAASLDGEQVPAGGVGHGLAARRAPAGRPAAPCRAPHTPMPQPFLAPVRSRSSRRNSSRLRCPSPSGTVMARPLMVTCMALPFGIRFGAGGAAHETSRIDPHRLLAVPPARGRGDGVGDRRRHPARWWARRSLGARQRADRILDDVCVHLGQVRGPGDAVVVEVQRPDSTRFDFHRLGQAVAQPHGHAAVILPQEHGRIHRPAHVVGRTSPAPSPCRCGGSP